MSKSAKAFRLSEQAVKSLQWLVSETGSNETAIVEMSLAFLRRSLEGERPDFVPEPNPAESEGLVSVILHKKKRKRH